MFCTFHWANDVYSIWKSTSKNKQAFDLNSHHNGECVNIANHILNHLSLPPPFMSYHSITFDEREVFQTMHVSTLKKLQLWIHEIIFDWHGIFQHNREGNCSCLWVEIESFHEAIKITIQILDVHFISNVVQQQLGIGI